MLNAEITIAAPNKIHGACFLPLALLSSSPTRSFVPMISSAIPINTPFQAV